MDFKLVPCVREETSLVYLGLDDTDRKIINPGDQYTELEITFLDAQWLHLFPKQACLGLQGTICTTPHSFYTKKMLCRILYRMRYRTCTFKIYQSVADEPDALQASVRARRLDIGCNNIFLTRQKQWEEGQWYFLWAGSPYPSLNAGFQSGGGADTGKRTATQCENGPL